MPVFSFVYAQANLEELYERAVRGEDVRIRHERLGDFRLEPEVPKPSEPRRGDHDPKE